MPTSSSSPPSPPPTSASLPIFTTVDCEFLQLDAEGARLFDSAADGALGGEPERASLFSFRQVIVVEVAESAAAAGGGASASAPGAATRFLEIEVDVDRVPNASIGSGGEAAARAPEPLAFLTLGGPGWARAAALLGLVPGTAVRFEKDAETGFVHASRAARWF